MGDKEGGDAGAFLNFADFLPCLQPQPGVQVGKRFIKQQNPRHLDQRPGNRDPLLLPARKLARFAVKQLLNLDKRGNLARAVLHFGAGGAFVALQVLQREQDVLHNGQVRVERIVLENHPDAAQFGRQGGDVFFTK